MRVVRYSSQTQLRRLKTCAYKMTTAEVVCRRRSLACAGLLLSWNPQPRQGRRPVARGGAPGTWLRPSLTGCARNLSRSLAPLTLLIALVAAAPASEHQPANADVDTTATETQADCYVSGAELATWRSSPDLVIVDTRSEDEFRQVRIPASINVQPYALRTKTYLKQKRLLLVHRGGTGAHLEPVCRALRGAGFVSVVILEGGLRFWSQRVGPLAGDRIAQRSLGRMSPAEFAREGRSDRWLVVDVSPRATPADVGGATVHIPFEGAPRFRGALQHAIREQHAAGWASFVLLINSKGEGYEVLEADTKQLEIEHLYFLEGGAEGYRQFRAEQATIIDAAARGCTLNACGGR